MPALQQHTPLLAVRDLSIGYAAHEALRSVSFEVGQGEIVGIVGESGSGKSTLLRAVSRLLSPAALVRSGEIVFDGRSMLDLSEREVRAMRGSQLAYLFQNGQLSLDPLFTVDRQFDEVLAVHGRRGERSLKRELLEKMGVADVDHVLRSLPSQLSGGLCQRVVLAFALSGAPRLLLADEPTSALDRDSQERVGCLLRSLNEEDRLAVLLVGHDIDFVSSLATRLIVMRRGEIVEEGPTSMVMEHPRAPYTQDLIAAIPRMSCELVEVTR